MEFKDRLRELRGKRTQKEIAKLLGVPLNSYNNWERCDKRTTGGRLC